MPTLPLIQDSVRLDTDTGRQRIQASPGAFGAEEARGLSVVAQGLNTAARVAEEKADEFDEAEALELDNEYSRRLRDRLYNQESGYLSTARGRAALEQRAQVEADLDGIAAEIAGRARNPRSQAMFRSVAQRRLQSALGDVAEYATSQRRAYENEQSESRIQEAMDNAVAAYADPAVVAANLATAVGEIDRIATRDGWSAETRASRIRRVQSDITTRAILQLASTDPGAAEELYARVRPSLSAQEAGELLTSMRAARREAEDSIIDEAWTFVAEGRQIPPDLWARVPGRARIDIQNERQRRAEGGAGGGDRTLIEDLSVMAAADQERFARVDLRAVRGALGASYRDLAVAQAEIRQGRIPPSVNAQRTTFNALVDTASTAFAQLDVDMSNESDTGRAFRAALLRELQAYQAAGGGAPNGDEAQVMIGRAWVGMRRGVVERSQGRVRGDRGRERARVRALSEVNVPYDLIDPRIRLQIVRGLERRGLQEPTRGEVENAYAALLRANPRNAEEVSGVYRSIIVGGGE
jgi:hypothetical protein